MRPRSELGPWLATALLAMASTWAQPATAQDQMPDDDVLESAAELQLQGQPWRAEALLRRLAEGGHVLAMERLALMHWYGQRLYPGQPWDPDVARLWFERAAGQGSVLGRHMLAVARRKPLPPATG